MKKTLVALCVLIPAIIFASNDSIPEMSWPREILADDIIITLYQPQLESYKDNVLEGRMAVSIKPKDKDMLFAALWFKAKLNTNFDDRTAVLDEFTIPRINFPGLEDTTKVAEFKELVIREASGWNAVMSIDRLLASLNEVDGLGGHDEALNNDPPEVFFRTEPAILVSIDSEPITKEDKENKVEYVVNTQFFMVRELDKKTWYMSSGPFWYSSSEITSGWEETKKVPAGIEDFANKNKQDQEPDSAALALDKAPIVIVVTKPAELIITDGEPDYATVEGTSLLYTKNSESDIIMDINTQEHYVLLAGRWYHSKTLADGDWKFQKPDDLPADFAKIPEESDMANVRSSVPGTPEAQDALLEQSIPQTAKVDRKTATVEVKYDGEPKFEAITGTEISYAVNTDKQVLKIKSKYYCVDDGIWFVSSAATGPWIVSDERPDEVDDLPAESPVYNVKYVYIYDSTPEVVYVGYTPGYTYSYAYGGVVVYGTGYYYPYWYGAYYYPRPVTYGYGVHYSPYSGWGFHVSVGIGWGYHPYGCWGARGYHHGYRHGYGHGYHHGYNRGYARGYAAGSRNSNRNVYNNRNNGVSSRDVARTTPANKGQATNKANRATPSSKPNNMYTDKGGNVYQRDQKGNYQNKSNGQQAGPTKERNQQQQGHSQNQQQNSKQNYNKNYNSQPSQNSKQQMDRSSQNRSRGSSNYNNYQRSGGGSSRGSYSGGGGSRSGGGGGGGRKR